MLWVVCVVLADEAIGKPGTLFVVEDRSPPRRLACRQPLRTTLAEAQDPVAHDLNVTPAIFAEVEAAATKGSSPDTAAYPRPSLCRAVGPPLVEENAISGQEYDAEVAAARSGGRCRADPGAARISLAPAAFGRRAHLRPLNRDCRLAKDFERNRKRHRLALPRLDPANHPQNRKLKKS